MGATFPVRPTCPLFVPSLRLIQLSLGLSLKTSPSLRPSSRPSPSSQPSPPSRSQQPARQQAPRLTAAAPAPQLRQWLRLLPVHLVKAALWGSAGRTLLSITFCEAKCRLGVTFELLQDLQRAARAPVPDWLRRSLIDLHRCVLASAHILGAMPGILLQQALNMPNASAVRAAACRQLRGGDTPSLKSGGRGSNWSERVQWLNKPAVPESQTATLTGGRGNLVWKAEFSPSGAVLALGGSDKMVHIVDATSGEVVTQLVGHTKEIMQLAWNPGSQRLLVSVASGGLRCDAECLLWDVVEGRALQALPLQGSLCSGLDWSRDGRLLGLVIKSQLQVLERDADGVFKLTCCTPAEQRVAFSPKGAPAVATIRSASASGSAKGADDVATNTLVLLDIHATQVKVRFTLQGHQGTINCICWRGKAGESSCISASHAGGSSASAPRQPAVHSSVA